MYFSAYLLHTDRKQRVSELASSVCCCFLLLRAQGCCLAASSCLHTVETQHVTCVCMCVYGDLRYDCVQVTCFSILSSCTVGSQRLLCWLNSSNNMPYYIHAVALLPLLHVMVDFLSNHIPASLCCRVQRNLNSAASCLQAGVSERTIAS